MGKSPGSDAGKSPGRGAGAVARPSLACAARSGEECPSLEIQFPSATEYLALLRPVARWFARKCRFPEKECSRIVLAVVEAVTNIIRHAYGGAAGQRITFRMTEIDRGLELEFLDHGKSISPAELERCSSKKSKGLRPGGLGVRMMKTCMDHFEYEPRPGGGARLMLRKIRGPACGEASP